MMKTLIKIRDATKRWHKVITQSDGTKWWHKMMKQLVEKSNDTNWSNNLMNKRGNTKWGQAVIPHVDDIKQLLKRWWHKAINIFIQ